MPANAINRSFEIEEGDVWVSLTPSGESSDDVCSFTLVASIMNSDDIQIRVSGGDAADWPPGAMAFFKSVNLHDFEFKGNVGDKVLVAGYAGA